MFTKLRDSLAAFLDDNSTFGKITGNIWLLVITNVLFILCSLPVITAGPALAAMYHNILKNMRSPDIYMSPVREFIEGLKENWKQGFIVWILFLAFAALAVLDIAFITASGNLSFMRWPVYLVMGLVIIMVTFLFPVMAAFESSLSQLFKNAFYFAAQKPLRAILCAAVNVVPLVLTYMDLQRLPLYAFIWSTCGFAVAAAIISRLLIKDFSRWLPEPDGDQSGE